MKLIKLFNKLHPHFVYGFFTALILLALVLASQYGVDFRVLKRGGLPILPTFGEAIDWQSIVILSPILLLFFKNLEGSTVKRFWYALMCVVFGWAIFDCFWITRAALMGFTLAGVYYHYSLTQLIMYPARNVVFLIFSSYYVRKKLQMSKWVAIAATVHVLYWVVLLPPIIYLIFNYHYYIFLYPVGYPIGLLPVILAFKRKTGKTWRQFLW